MRGTPVQSEIEMLPEWTLKVVLVALAPWGIKEDNIGIQFVQNNQDLEAEISVYCGDQPCPADSTVEERIRMILREIRTPSDAIGPPAIAVLGGASNQQHHHQEHSPSMQKRKQFYAQQQQQQQRRPGEDWDLEVTPDDLQRQEWEHQTYNTAQKNRRRVSSDVSMNYYAAWIGAASIAVAFILYILCCRGPSGGRHKKYDPIPLETGIGGGTNPFGGKVY